MAADETTGPITTTLNRIREHSLCTEWWEGWAKLLKHLGKTKADDEPLPFSVILASNGLDDALWCCRAEPQHASLWRHFAVDCAETVKHLMTDERSLNALVVARRHADGKATDDELSAARAAALAADRAASWAAALAADRAAALASVASWAAALAADRAAALASVASWAADRDAASAADRAAALASVAAWAADSASARDAARAGLAQRFLRLVETGVWSPARVVDEVAA